MLDVDNRQSKTHLEAGGGALQLASRLGFERPTSNVQRLAVELPLPTRPPYVSRAEVRGRGGPILAEVPRPKLITGEIHSDLHYHW